MSRLKKKKQQHKNPTTTWDKYPRKQCYFF